MRISISTGNNLHVKFKQILSALGLL